MVAVEKSLPRCDLLGYTEHGGYPEVMLEDRLLHECEVVENIHSRPLVFYPAMLVYSDERHIHMH